MQLDYGLLERFENGLDPQNLTASAVRAEVVGYGEMSTVFKIDNHPAVVFKRLPLFKDRAAAESYVAMFDEYCGLLKQLGIFLPESETIIIEVPKRPVTLYIAQAMLPAERFGHRLIHTQDKDSVKQLIESIMAASEKVWQFCKENGPDLEVALDGQLSNWVLIEEGNESKLVFIDTGTPFIKKNGQNLLDPDLLIQAVPKPLRWLIKWLFADEVLNRYYDPQKNMIDLATNLFKEQKPELIPVFIEVINQKLPAGVTPLTIKGIESYYREDKFIWWLFLGLRRIDCWLATNIFRQRYEFILPGKIKR
ncbi:MAG: hypothetical protein HOE30_02155 [Deltaproteobacteria bacterium]|nr:hypothetical protein [Deltaproteobacteria bacterium]